MKYYYLINGKIMSANEKMPERKSFIENHITNNCVEPRFNSINYYNEYDNWHKSLQPCEISDSEFERVNKYLANTNAFDFDSNFINPIEVTDIVEKKSKCNDICSICHKTPKEQAKGCNLIECYKGREGYNKTYLTFKHPKQVEEIEAVELFIKVIDAQLNLYNYLNPLTKLSYDDIINCTSSCVYCKDIKHQ